MNKNKKDYLLISLGLQFIVCAILFGICFGLKTTSSELFNDLKKGFFNKISENSIIEDNDKVNKIIESTKKEIKSTVSVISDNGDTQPANEDTETLSAEVKAVGGKDYGLENENDIPDNVCVGTYTVNRKMILPLEGEVTSEFGTRVHPINGELRFHAGIDIAAPTGTPIYATYEGEVIKAEYDQWNGYHIKIQHENEIMTVYCHCEKLNVKKGDIVHAGEMIATVGSTGSSTGPHLHFEFRINNISYDPEIALDEAVSVV